MPETQTQTGPTRGDTAGGDTAGGDSAARRNERRPVTVVFSSDDMDGNTVLQVRYFRDTAGIDGFDRWLKDMQFVADIARGAFMVHRVYKNIRDEARGVEIGLRHTLYPADLEIGLSTLIRGVRHDSEGGAAPIEKKLNELREMFPELWKRGLFAFIRNATDDPGHSADGRPEIEIVPLKYCKKDGWVIPMKGETLVEGNAEPVEICPICHDTLSDVGTVEVGISDGSTVYGDHVFPPAGEWVEANRNGGAVE